MQFLSRLSVRSRFAMLGLLGLFMAVIPTLLYANRAWLELQSAGLELAGVEPARAILRVVQLVQQHRSVSALVFAGNMDVQATRVQRQNEVDAALAHWSDLQARGTEDANVRASRQKLTHEWQDLVRTLQDGASSAEQSFQLHSALIADLLRSLDQLADVYGLSMDPETASFQLARASLLDGPVLTEGLAKARGKGAAMLASRSSAPEERVALALYLGQADQAMQRLARDYDKATSARSAVKQQLGATPELAQAQLRDAVALSTEQILTSVALSLPATDYMARMQQALDVQFRLLGQGFDALDLMLQQREQTLRNTLLWVSVPMALLAALAVLLSITAARSISRELGAEPAVVASIAHAIATGDLTTRIVVPPGLEGSLLGAMQRMQAALRDLVTRVRENAQSVAHASAEIAQGNQDLSGRTENQASALEQTASSMQQLSTQVQHSADSARQANQLAAGAAAVALRGGTAVARVVETMKDIHAASRKIADITSLIDAIAFQTNILALNAAVEAARAGEQGRGFAVVATEVRSLAGRSADAAKEIKILIGASVTRVEQGSALVDEAGSTMGEVVGAIQKASDLVGEISAASHEQAVGVAQVGEAVGQMDQATQKNAALVQHMASAADGLNAQSAELVAAVSVFKLQSDALPQALAVRNTLAAAKPPGGAERRTALAPAAALRPAHAPIADYAQAGGWKGF